MAKFTVRFFSKSLLRKTEVNVVIPTLALHTAMQVQDPAYYQHSTEKFPLFLMLHGFGDDNDGWMTECNLQSLCDRYRIAAVTVSGENKWYLNASPIDNWHTFLEQELPDFLYGQFAKLDSDRKPVICGVSMGGFGALWNGMTSPEKYSAIVAMSPATRPDGDLNDESRFPSLRTLFLDTKGKLPYTYLTVGEQDFIIQPSREFDAWLEENEIGVRYKFVPGYDHSWNFWRVQIEDVCAQLKSRHII